MRNVTCIAVAVLLLLTGCQTLLEQTHPFALTAQPLESVGEAAQSISDDLYLKNPANGSVSLLVPNVAIDPTSIAWVLVGDSEEKCLKFAKGLWAVASGSDVSLDILATTFSGVGTAVAKAATKSVFSTLAGIATGTKSAVSSDFLNGITVSHLIQEIAQTYGVKMDNYKTYLKTVAGSPAVNPYGERAAILDIHNNCSLPYAEAAVSNALSQPTPGNTTPQSAAVTLDVSDTTKVPSPPASTDFPDSIAKALAALIAADPNFKAANITVTSTTAAQISVSLPSGWQLFAQVAPPAGKAPAIIQVTPPGGAGPTVLLTVSESSPETNPAQKDLITISATAPSASSK